MKKKTRSRSTTRRSPGKKNKKLQAEGFRMPATISLLVVLLFSVGLFYLWFCSHTEALARQISVEEDQLAELRRTVAGEEVRWNGLVGPRNLRAALKAHRLDMNWPQPEQVVHIRDMALWESNAGELNVVTRVDHHSGAY
ncbi:hypothetical protein P3T73_06150 [Kiritimatiellota bacterium B12222]|nr:hypothetical protein P3T73_06150 [Kiritimatiellota bacterium B12222]